MLLHEIIGDMTKHEKLREALEEMATQPFSETVTTTISSTFTAHLSAGAKSVRISVQMIPEGGMFAEDLI